MATLWILYSLPTDTLWLLYGYSNAPHDTQVELIKALLRGWADVNAVNNSVTPIMLARDPMIIWLLLNEEANIELGDDEEGIYKNELWNATVADEFEKVRGLAYMRGREMGLAPTATWGRHMRPRLEGHHSSL